jgi:Ras-related protein Rab-18
VKDGVSDPVALAPALRLVCVPRWPVAAAQVKLLVGNKIDKAADGAVSTRDGEAWARARGMLFLESSARNPDSVKAVFEEVVARIIETPGLLKDTAPPAARVGLVRPEAPKPPVAEGGGGCC